MTMPIFAGTNCFLIGDEATKQAVIFDAPDHTVAPLLDYAVEQKLDVPLVRHRLRHVVTAFTGHVRTASGQVHDLERIVGIAEDNDTWW